MDDKTADIIVQVIDNAVSALLKYRNVPPATPSSAPSPRWPGRQVGQAHEFYGVGNSGIVAADAQFGLSASALPPPSSTATQVMSATMLEPRRAR